MLGGTIDQASMYVRMHKFQWHVHAAMATLCCGKNLIASGAVVFMLCC